MTIIIIIIIIIIIVIIIIIIIIIGLELSVFCYRTLWGLRSRRRRLDFVDSDLQIENIRACPN